MGKRLLVLILVLILIFILILVLIHVVIFRFVILVATDFPLIIVLILVGFNIFRLRKIVQREIFLFELPIRGEKKLNDGDHPPTNRNNY